MKDDSMRVVYIHGYKGSPSNGKTEILGKSFHVVGPVLHEHPFLAISKLFTMLEELEENNEDFMIVGSSLGGYYADYVGSAFNVPTCLINPLPAPKYMKAVDKWYEYEQYLETLKPNSTISNPMLVLLDKGDEVFDYKLAYDKYCGRAKVVAYEGGSHRFDHMKEGIEHIERLANTIV